MPPAARRLCCSGALVVVLARCTKPRTKSRPPALLGSVRPAGLQRDRDAQRVKPKTSSNQQFLRWAGWHSKAF